MLVSHRKKFIFTKTVKTAGTSVESYFEKYCMPEGEWQESRGSDEYVSDQGIIGCRGAVVAGAKWYNHMSADKIQALVGPGVWDSYFKFTTVRNPFDKLISGFRMFEQDKERYTWKQRVKAFGNRISNTGRPIHRVKGATEIERFRSWIRLGGTITDRNKFFIQGKVCVDYFIRYENLHEDVSHVCDVLSVPFEPEAIPHLKKRGRPPGMEIADYYDRETEKIVRDSYAWELDRFGYDMPVP